MKSKKKKSLSCFGDKRFVLDYGIHTLAYIHKYLKKIRFSQAKASAQDENRF